MKSSRKYSQQTMFFFFSEHFSAKIT